MTYTDDTIDLLRDSAAEFLAERREFSAHKADVTVAAPFAADLWRELAELGWLGLGLPEENGGPGFGLRESAVLCEQFGRVASPVAYLAASALPAAVLKHAGHLDKLAPMLTSGERPFAVAWQDTEAASPQIIYEAAQVTGTHRFVVAANNTSVLLVNASDQGAPLWVAVDAASPQVKLERFAMGTGDAAHVHFDHAPVLFGEPLMTGDAAQQATLDAQQAGRLAIAAQLIGLTSGVLDKTLAYVSDRVQFARPIASFQSIRHRCVDLYIGMRLAKASLNTALRAYETAPDAPATQAAISAAKARCGDVAVQTGREAIQMHGAMGFTEEGGVGVYLRAAMHLRAWLGTPMQQRRQYLALRAAGEVNHVTA